MVSTPSSVSRCGPSGDCDASAPIACTLGADDACTRHDEWTRLLGSATGRTAIDGGLRVTLSGDADLGELSRLIVAERGCCDFYRFALTIDERGTALEVTAPDDARIVLTSLFGEAA